MTHRPPLIFCGSQQTILVNVWPWNFPNAGGTRLPSKSASPPQKDTEETQNFFTLEG